MYEVLGAVREPVALSPQEALDSAEAILSQQGYRILQRREVQVIAERRTRGGWLVGQATLYLAVAVRPLPEGGVEIKLMGTDREEVQARRAEWSRWAENLPKIATEYRADIQAGEGGSTERTAKTQKEEVEGKTREETDDKSSLQEEAPKKDHVASEESGQEARIGSDGGEAAIPAEDQDAWASTTPWERRPRVARNKLGMEKQGSEESPNVGAPQPTPSEYSDSPQRDAVNQDTITNPHRTVRCLYCGNTEIREDQLEAHIVESHPGAQPPHRLPVATQSSAGSPEKLVVPQRSTTSPADREVLEMLKRLADGATETPLAEAAVVSSRLNYLAKVSVSLLPRAFAFASRGVLFTGNGPYEAHRLARLLPDGVEACVDGEDLGRVSFDLVVVGQNGFYGDRMKRAVTSGGQLPRFVPQEGFLDELLFGRSWWTEEVELLNATLVHHPGLKYAKSLENLTAFTRHADPHKKFRWPSTEARETKKPVGETPGYRDSTPLFDLGYRITGMSRSKRWEVLTHKALPTLGLREVAETIARLCRDRKRQVGGRQKYSDAISEWEHDLARLKKGFYEGPHGGFRWPSTGR